MGLEAREASLELQTRWSPAVESGAFRFSQKTLPRAFGQGCLFLERAEPGPQT